MNRRDDLASSIAGRDDADALTSAELEVVIEGGHQFEKVRAFADAVAAMLALATAARTVGDARNLLARIEELDQMADKI